ncbi:MAG: glycosyltransferase [Gammaproteobacteria bacterium]|nr:glycosyltransferase [Gammaproteobacteria bacterium]
MAFSEYLQAYGWDVCVLTIQAKAYENVATENEILIPPHVKIQRAWGLDARRSLSIFGKYPLFLALPDRWQSWILGATIKGGRVIRNWSPDVIMTTYPIPSAHAIGWFLNRKFKIPWVADFRDPMLQPDYPTGKWQRWAFAEIEKQVFAHAKEIVVTTDGCRQMYLDRYPAWKKANVTTVSNGFDPALFSGTPRAAATEKSDTLVLLHSGLLYPNERNPMAFFKAVRSLQDSGFLRTINVEFQFRASGNEEAYLKIISELGIDSQVRLLPRIPYVAAIEEMRAVDALMIFQASNCNNQIPAKAYEYMYCQKPILALTDPAGDTGKLLSSVGVDSIAHLENSDEIEEQLMTFLRQLQIGKAFIVSEKDALRFSRKSLTGKISDVLTRAIGES